MVVIALAGGLGHGQAAGTHRHAVEVHRAGAAVPGAAAVLRAGQAERVAQGPEERRVAGDVDPSAGAVDDEGERGHGVLEVERGVGAGAPGILNVRPPCPSRFVGAR